MAAGWVTVTVLGGDGTTTFNFRKWSHDGTPAGLLYDVYADPVTLEPIDTTATVPVAGADAHDAVPASNPFGIAALAATALPAGVSNADLVRLLADQFGRLITRSVPRELIVPVTTLINNSTSAVDLFAAGGSGILLDLYFVLITNTSATATEIAFKDAAAGTTRFTLSAPANDSRGYVIGSDAGWPQAVANNKWTITAADLIASDIHVSALAAKNK